MNEDTPFLSTVQLDPRPQTTDMDARCAHFIDGLRGSVGKDNIAGFDNARDCCSVPGLEAFSLGEAGLLIGCFCS